MREGEELHAGFAGDKRSLAGGRVAGLARPLALVGEKRCLVDEKLGTGGGLDDGGCRAGIASEDERSARTHLSQHLSRRDDAPVRQRHALASLQKTALATVGTPSRVASSTSNLPGRSSSTSR